MTYGQAVISTHYIILTVPSNYRYIAIQLMENETINGEEGINLFKRNRLAFVLLLTLLIMLPMTARAEVTVFFNQQQISFDQQPIVDQQAKRTLVPFRALWETLGGEAWYDDTSHTVIGIKEDQIIELPVDQDIAILNGDQVKLDVSTKIINGRVMVPLRFVSENLGCQVETSGDLTNLTVYISGKEKIVVGTDASFPPFESVTDGQLVGFDIDIMQAIAEAENLSVQFKHVSFDGLIPGLLNGQIDAIISGMSITEERQRRIMFSEPYFVYGLCIVVKADNNYISKTSHLRKKFVAVEEGSYAAWKAEELPGTVSYFPDLNRALMALKLDNVHAVLCDFPAAAHMIINEFPDLKIVGEIIEADYFGIAVNDRQLLEKINRGLKTIMENGVYDQIYQKWFGINSLRGA